MLAITSFLDDPLTVFVTGMILLILFFWYFATEVERRKRNVGTVLLFGVCALCILAATPIKDRLKGSIDIAGGSSFTMRVQPKDDGNGNLMPVTVQQVDQAILVIEKRLNSMGTTEPMISRQGDDKIQVQMPGVETEESEKIKKELEKVAKLELKQVSERSDEVGDDGKSLAQRVLDGKEIVPNYLAYILKQKNEDGIETSQPLLLSRRTALGGSDISNAVPSPQQSDAVAITLNNAGKDKMINLTKNMRAQQDRIAIVLDGEVISAPVVNQVPLGKQFIIEGLREPGEVQSLANALMNPLENALKIEEFRNVSPTLGEAVVTQGIWAGLIGLAITAVFVLIYYRMAGFVALFGLAVNGIVLFGVMAMFGFRFSLPGIAGMILTIGMAVDANVLIYERLREELAAGKSLKNAISASYEKAFTAIFDSNVTSLITAIILFWLGSNSIKGFAVTLTIGIVASMFSAILVTRVLFRWAVDGNLLKGLTFFNLIKPTNFDFMGKGKACAVASVLLVLISFAAFGIKQEKSLGVDFTGGTLIQFQLGKKISLPVTEVQGVLEKMTGLAKNPSAQEQSNPATGALLTIRCDSRDTDAITTKLRESIPVLGEMLIQYQLGKEISLPVAEVQGILDQMTGLARKPVAELVNSETGTMLTIRSDSRDSKSITMKLRESIPVLAEKTSVDNFVIDSSKEEVSALIGGTFLRDSIIALALGLIAIMLYITVRFEFSFALGGFVAILHDVIISIGIVVLMGRELSLIHVGAILTIAGYSINDTIVIFDRIRETLLVRQGSIRTIMNEAINATLSRTVLTSLTTIITVAILSFFGGSNLRDFSVMILIGLVVGTYSSIFVAAPIVYWWSRRKGGNLREAVLATEIKAEAATATP